MENSVSLYGASGHCKVIIDILNSRSITIDAIIDDNPIVTSLLQFAIVKPENFDFSKIKNMIISIGNNHVRKVISRKLNIQFSKAIHSSSIISKEVTIGYGTVVMAGAIINSGVVIGNHCIINSGAIVEHDCVLNDFVQISPKATLAGNITIGEGTQIGIGATIIQGIKIGKWAMVGAGAIIINDIPDFAVVVGNPGRIIKYNKENE
jgi:acetyltransferase EpsM